MTEPGTVIDAADLSGYLASRGWQQVGTSRGAFIWGLEPGCRLLVPERREYDDDDELLTEAVRQLSAWEERPEPDIVLDISEPMVDSQFYRMHPDTPSGTIPLPAGVVAVQAIHNLMRAAAITADVGPKLLIEGRRSAPVDRFMRRVSLGSARPGSYVLTSRVPVAGSLPGQASQQLDLLSAEGLATTVSDGRLSGRGVVAVLHRAIRTAHAAAGTALQAQGQLSAFYDGVEEGLSANLCRALAELGSFNRHDADEYRSFEVGFGWARGMPTDEPSEPISFSENMVGILMRADEELTRLAKSGPAQIVGKVDILKRSAGEQPRIKIIGQLRTEEGAILGRRSVWITVTTAQYEAAWEAQRDGLDMVVDGRLDTRRGRLQMEPIRIDVTRRQGP